MTKNACCRCVLSFCRAIPVIFIILLTFWSYYAYVVVFCIQYAYTLIENVLFLIFYHILFVLFLWSFLKAIITRPIKPPAEFFLSAEDWVQINAITEEVDRNRYLEALILERKLPIETTNDSGMVRLCPSCSLIKPDRCHHCSTCDTCLLKMDHHCPWIDNCVGFHNYKYFVIFLFWGFLYCLYIVCTTIVYFIDFWETLQTVPPTRYNFLFLFFTAIMFGFAQSILLFYHIYLISKNRTTLGVVYTSVNGCYFLKITVHFYSVQFVNTGQAYDLIF
ncbi:unnamed protein product [Hymenolepis diminuta]|uniref:Palmitoyltransferase n=1 Tax=Hymenolepis diminuta TaxID=6216 RepID=A0A564YJD7_HYMDI|nr:unnamed protein product [Hymenolepis diminuta]